MPVWLINLIPIAWRFLKHFAVYLIMGVILFAPSYISYQYGWRKGYSCCAKDRPTYGNVGTVVNKTGVDFKWAGVYLKLLILDTKIGR